MPCRTAVRLSVSVFENPGRWQAQEQGRWDGTFLHLSSQCPVVSTSDFIEEIMREVLLHCSLIETQNILVLSVSDISRLANPCISFIAPALFPLWNGLWLVQGRNHQPTQWSGWVHSVQCPFMVWVKGQLCHTNQDTVKASSCYLKMQRRQEISCQCLLWWYNPSNMLFPWWRVSFRGTGCSENSLRLTSNYDVNISNNNNTVEFRGALSCCWRRYDLHGKWGSLTYRSI